MNGAGVVVTCECGRPTSLEAGVFRCSCGAEVGHLENGIAVIGTPTPYWGEIPQPDMERVLAEGEEIGWHEAVMQLAPELRDNALSSNRGAFEDILPLLPGSRILDIGAGLGAISAELSRSHDVVALEGVSERARFIALRKRQARLDRLTVINGDLHRTRFADAQFDGVIVNGVLEWAGLFDLNGSPREAQRRFMNRMRLLLRPGGYVYVGIENRFGLASIMGMPDHSGLPYTSLVPRFLAHWICRRHAGYRSALNRGYRTYTYSYRGYRKLFAEAGLRIRTAWIAPYSYNMPTDLVLLHTGAVELYTRLRCHTSRINRLAALKSFIKMAGAKERVWRWLGANYVFVLEGVSG